ncbi:N-acetyltransferase [Leuconostocaceae bacterium ESL0958]|nr:N-acetyltransferase [Leuconostocaceae bacterium ESL0958]
MTVRVAGPADEPVLADLLAASFPADTLPTMLLAEQLKRGSVRYLLINEGQGFLSYRQLFEEVEIYLLAVAPKARRQGLARALLEFLMGALPAGSRLLLEVAADNRPALALYQQLGFQVYHRRQAYYAQGQDALLMEKRL